MSSALSVEKTSKRGGRIIHEKDRFPPPPPVFAAPTAPSERAVTPPTLVGEYGEPDSGGGDEEDAQQQQQQQTKPSITDIMRNPSKVVVCKVRVFFFT